MQHVEFAYDLVGFCGPAMSGKDSAAKALTGLGWQRVAFADPLKASALALDPVIVVPHDHETVRRRWPELTIADEDAFLRLSEVVEEFGWDAAKTIPEVRQILQRMGTECGRNVFGTDCWVNLAKRSILQNVHDGCRTVITDVRFPEEADMIHSMGGIVIKVVRPGVGSLNSHASEVGISNFDRVLHNNSTISDLHQKLLGMVAASEHSMHIVKCRCCDHEWREPAAENHANVPCAMCGSLAGECVSG